MEIPNPLSIDRARGLMEFQFDKDLAAWLKCATFTLSRARKNNGGMLSREHRAMVVAHLLESKPQQQTAQAG